MAPGRTRRLLLALAALAPGARGLVAGALEAARAPHRLAHLTRAPHSRAHLLRATRLRTARVPLAEMGAASEGAAVPKFDLDTAVALAGFAFEVYNEPGAGDARWERGADGCDVAFMSEAFACECYSGRLEVRLIEAKDLPRQKQLAQAILSGSDPDPYVVFALNEQEPPKREGAAALTRASDIARSSTCWSRGTGAKTSRAKGGWGGAMWGEDERFSLYVRNPSRAQLALTVFDEEVLSEDVTLGAASVELSSVLRNFTGSESERSWEGWVPLTWRPTATQDNAVLAGVAAGTLIAGPAGALVGGVLGNFVKKGVQGEVRIAIKYEPLRKPTESNALIKERDLKRVLKKYESILPKSLLAKEAALKPGEIAAKVAPRGATEGIDWSELSKRVGTKGFVEADAFELCCFIKHNETSTELGIWRDEERRLVVLSFRGTSDPRDMITDVNLLQTPWEEREDGKRGKEDDPRKVHAGFFASAKSVNRRLKELLVAACANNPGEWEVLITGHSLGGALATLTAAEIASGVDVSRGFKTRKDDSWLARISEYASRYAATLTGDSSFKEMVGAQNVSLGRVRLYTFGAPRVGNSEWATYFESLGIETFRIVNGADMVPRLPRHGSAAGALLDYEHVGRTVLIDEDGTIPEGLWIEGESADGDCPLRGVNPLTNPFADGKVLAELTASATTSAKEVWNEFEKERRLGNVSRALDLAAASLGKAKETLESKLGAFRSMELVSVLGLEPKFVESELAMIDSITKGTGVKHHLEPSYYAGMKNALDIVQGLQPKPLKADALKLEADDAVLKVDEIEDPSAEANDPGIEIDPNLDVGGQRV